MDNLNIVVEKSIKSELDYNKALNRVDELMELNPKIETALSDELETLTMLIEKYEEEKWTIREPDDHNSNLPLHDKEK